MRIGIIPIFRGVETFYYTTSDCLVEMKRCFLTYPGTLPDSSRFPICGNSKHAHRSLFTVEDMSYSHEKKSPSNPPDRVDLEVAHDAVERAEMSGYEPPDGGLQAWLVAAGCSLAFFASFGIVNSYVRKIHLSIRLL